MDFAIYFVSIGVFIVLTAASFWLGMVWNKDFDI